jgi:hypothetical protein
MTCLFYAPCFCYLITHSNFSLINPFGIFSLFLTFHSFSLLTHLFSIKLISDTCFLPPPLTLHIFCLSLFFVTIFHHNLPLIVETLHLAIPDEINCSLCTKYFPTKCSLADTCYSLSPVILIVLYSKLFFTFFIDGGWHVGLQFHHIVLHSL